MVLLAHGAPGTIHLALEVNKTVDVFKKNGSLENYEISVIFKILYCLILMAGA